MSFWYFICILWLIEIIVGGIVVAIVFSARAKRRARAAEAQKASIQTPMQTPIQAPTQEPTQAPRFAQQSSAANQFVSTFINMIYEPEMIELLKMGLPFHTAFAKNGITIQLGNNVPNQIAAHFFNKITMTSPHPLHGVYAKRFIPYKDLGLEDLPDDASVKSFRYYVLSEIDKCPDLKANIESGYISYDKAASSI